MPKILRTAAMILLAIALYSMFVFAQSDPGRIISGTVSDETGATLPGASVIVKGTKIGATTDINGKFELNIPADSKTLFVRFIGMEDREVSIGNKSVFNIAIKYTTSTLNEVVSIGYGAIRKANVTTSISSVSGKDIKNLPLAGADQALQGKVAGVTVTNNGGQPGGGVSVRVRGITAINGNEPLFVIDGVIVGNNQRNSLDQNELDGASGQTVQSVLATLNPSDIASIDILKDASAQAIYGAQAVNGVVLINTKRGKSGVGKITYETYYGMSEVPRKLDVMSLSQYASYNNSLVTEVRAEGFRMDSIAEFKNPSLLGLGTDWQDEIYQRGAAVNHQFSFSGASDKTSYRFSLGYFDQTGTLIETGFKKYNLTARIDQNFKKWARAGLSVNASKSNQKIGLSDASNAVTSSVLYNSPLVPVRDNFGNYIKSSTLSNGSIIYVNNPVIIASLRDVRSLVTKAFGTAYAEVDVFKSLTFRSEGNYDFDFSNDKAFQPFIQNSITKEIVLGPSRLIEQRNNNLYWAFKNFANYNRDFNGHAVSGTTGIDIQESKYDYRKVNRDDFGEGMVAGADNWAMLSYYARANYTYNNKYSISGTVRRDGSANFGPGRRWASSYALSASWTATQEAFLKDLKHLSYLKLRFSIGSLGNSNTESNRSYPTSVTLFQRANWGAGGLSYNVPNSNLEWEAVKSYNGGIDLTTLNKRADLTIDIYKKVSINMLLPAQLSAFSELGTSFNDTEGLATNGGQITNRGIDIGLNTYNLQGNSLNWKTNFNFTHYKNNLDFLNNPNSKIIGQINKYGAPSSITLSEQGQPIGVYYGYVTNGLFRTEAELNDGINYGIPVGRGKLGLGDVRYKDLNGDNKIDGQDMTIIGNPNPKFTYGMTNTLAYKNFDFGVFVQGSYGGDIFNYSRRYTEGLNSLFYNQTTAVLDRFTPANATGSLPRFNPWHSSNTRISDRFVEDGSYLRIQNISLGYNLPKSVIRKAKMSSLKIYVSAQNLHTFTNYSGVDPEVGAYNSSIRFMNVDNGHYPNPRTFTAGANIEF